MRIKRLFILAALGVAAVFVLAACSSAASDDDHDEGDRAHIETPAEYADLTNPFEGDHEAAEAGAEIYEINCSTCHGPEGLGDGPAAEGLDPKPASLADAHLMEDMSDGALFWRVSEGGGFAPFNSAMPPWKDTLTEDQIWQVITFLREFAEDEHD